MGNDELLNYISMFREKAEQGKLVIFVGAGVSCNVDGMPSWNALIQNMAKAIDYSRCDTCRHRLESCENTCLLKDDFSTDELLKVPQHVFNKDQELYYRILNESIPAVTADAPLSSAIFDINPAHIITTNYDQLLESSKNIFCEQYQVIARHEKYMSCFIAHKDAIIPIIQNRIKSEEASETEKRILYGFLLSGNEIWKI